MAQTTVPATAITNPGPATSAPAALAGRWQGPLSIPGGSVPVEFAISQPGINKYIITLDLPAKRLSRVPTSLTFRGDTLLFYAVTVECRFVCVQSADGRELRGIWTQPGLRVPLTLARFVPGTSLITSGSKAVAVKATTYHIEAVTLTSQPSKTKLTGTLSIPDGPGPFPAAVLLSDMGSQDRDTRQGDYRLFATMAATLARQGVAVLRLDDRGVGQSEGVGSQTTTAELVRDARAGLEYLRLRPSIDAAQTGLIGHGEGGNVALLAAAQPEPPGFVVTLAASGLVGMDLLASQPEPVTTSADTALAGAARRQLWADVLNKAEKLRTSGSNAAQVETYVAQQRLKLRNEERKRVEAMLRFRRTMLEIVRQTASDDQAQAIVVNMLRQRYPDQDPALARARASQLITPWYRYYLKFDPQLNIAEVQCPVLLLNGTDDTEVNATSNLAALEKGLKSNKRVTVRRLPGVNHWFQTPVGELLVGSEGTADLLVSGSMLETVRDWILEQDNKLIGR
ncbi:alpha/beta hydrolase family protein [Hymenobacter antarcticus]|uniref:alpha/beta hydrolase family protein n=1 Tax=Hymenobacter antarcticus TaxID=486270 RepID=UPI0031EAD059